MNGAAALNCGDSRTNIMRITNSENKTNDMDPNQLEQIKKFTKIVADTGDFQSIRQF